MIHYLLAAEGIEVVSKEAFAILLFLLPGFISAWVFFGLTAYPKKETFDRLVQAFIFTMFVKGMNIASRKIWWTCWHPYHLQGLWNEEKEFVWSIVNAVLLGLVVSLLANRDWAHWVLRVLYVTDRDSRPPNTYNTADRKRRFVVLTLKDGRRIRGWAKQFPEQYDAGRFVLVDIRWLDDLGGEVQQEEVAVTMVDVSEIRMVQFLVVEPIKLALTDDAISPVAHAVWQEWHDRRDKLDWDLAKKQLIENRHKNRWYIRLWTHLHG